MERKITYEITPVTTYRLTRTVIDEGEEVPRVGLVGEYKTHALAAETRDKFEAMDGIEAETWDPQP